jgi:hypothetical protein
MINGEVLDCCNGEGLIGTLRDSALIKTVHTNEQNLDPSKKNSWHEFPQVDWVVTHPPFIDANRIIPTAVDHVRTGVAALLRLSFLEPTYERQDFLSRTPPTKLIVLPRINATDSLTSAWFIWRKNRPWDSGSILVLEK